VSGIGVRGYDNIWPGLTGFFRIDRMTKGLPR
jgi:hypothetical protein